MPEPEYRRPTAKAQQLRNDATEFELLLWQRLKGRRFLDVKFSRQMPVGPYICDFMSRAHKLVIELDGGQHGDRVEYDEARITFIEQQGFRVLRFWNNELAENINGVMERIAEALTDTPTP